MSDEIEFLTKPDAPESLTPIVDAYKIKPYVVEVTDSARYKEKGLDYDEDFVVAVGKLKAIHFSEFESTFGMTLNNALLAGIHAQLVLGVFQPEAVETLKKEMGVYHDKDGNKYVTPYGTLTKHPSTFYLDIIAFCLSRWGRVCEKDDLDNLEEISMKDVLDHLDPELLNITNEEGEMVFHKLMAKLGIDLFTALNEQPEVAEGEEPESETPKPTPKKRASRAKKNEGSKTKES